MEGKQIVRLVITPHPTGNILHKTVNESSSIPKENQTVDFVDKTNEFSKIQQNQQIYFGNYKNLFNKLIDQNRKFFTKEYGKSQLEFQNYLQNKTNLYDNDHKFVPELEPKFDLNAEIKYQNKSRKLSIRGRLKKTKTKSKLSLRISTNILTKKSSFFTVPVNPFQYKLSDPEMMKKGISLDTQLTGRAIRFYIFDTKLTNPSVSFLLLNKPENIFYSNKNLALSYSIDGHCTLYNKKGIKSIQLLPGIVGPLLVIYSSKERLFNGKCEPAPLAVFDFNGFGVVYDEDGNKRLIYDQAQGILFDNPSKIPLKWKWQIYDSIIRRREEMKYLKPDEMPDIDNEEKQRIKAKRELTTKKFRKKKKKKMIPVISDSGSVISPSSKTKFSPIKRRSIKTASSPQRPISKLNKPEADPHLVAKLFGDRKDNLEKSKLPVVLKFTQTGCVIEPLLIPCKKSKGLLSSPEQEEEFPLEKASRKTLSLRSARTGQRKDMKSKFNRNERLREMLTRCIPNVLSPTATGTGNIITDLKPIVMKINDTASLVVNTQEHIHIDFLCYPFHFKFEIGVIVNTDSLNKLFASKDRLEGGEPTIPCLFEVMQDKSWELKAICDKLKQIREEAKENLEKSNLKYSIK